MSTQNKVIKAILKSCSNCELLDKEKSQDDPQYMYCKKITLPRIYDLEDQSFVSYMPTLLGFRHAAESAYPPIDSQWCLNCDRRNDVINQAVIKTCNKCDMLDNTQSTDDPQYMYCKRIILPRIYDVVTEEYFYFMPTLLGFRHIVEIQHPPINSQWCLYCTERK